MVALTTPRPGGRGFRGSRPGVPVSRPAAEGVCQAASTTTGDSPEAILVAWLRRFYAYFTIKRFVAAELLEHADRDDPVFGAGRARVLDASRPLLRAAQESGEIRTDLTLDQILDLVAAIAKIPGDAGY